MNIVTYFRNSPEFEIGYNIRVDVFVKEQGVPIEAEMDEYDDIATHVLLYDNDEPAACGRIVFKDDHAVMGRIAVARDKRGKNFGRLICEKLIDIAIENKANKIILHAQCYAIPFYEKVGFVAEGEVFDEDGIDHRKMVQKL